MDKLSLLLRKGVAAILLSSAYICGSTQFAHAAFEFNFKPSGLPKSSSYANIDCRDGESTTSPCIRQDFGTNAAHRIDPDTTPFYQEIVRAHDGYRYYHVVVGDENSDFAIEYYIWIPSDEQDNWLCCYSNSVPMSSSAGAIYNGGDDSFSSVDNTVDPLARTRADKNWKGSGNGTGAPTRVVFHQRTKDVEMTQNVIKGTLLGKPNINQVITEGSTLLSEFELKMDHLNYDDMNTAGDIVKNSLVVHGKDITIDFDTTTGSEKGYVSAGQYKYNPAWDGFAGSRGTYDYSEGGEYNVYDVEWSLYSDWDVNIPNTD